MINDSPLIGIILLNWNGLAIKYKNKPILKLCMESLLKTDYKNIKLLILDADSEDGSIDYLSRFKGIEILKIEDKGWPYANNIGMKYFLNKYPNLGYFLLLSNDIWFKEKDWLTKLINNFKKDNKIMIVGCKLLYPDRNVVQYSGSHVSFLTGQQSNDKCANKSKYVKSITGALMLIKKDLIKEIGLIDEIFNPFAWEDADFCERTINKGYKIFYEANTNIRHVGGASTSYLKEMKIKTIFDKEALIRYSIRNNFIFLLRYKPYFIPSAFFFHILRAFINIRDNIKIRSKHEIRIMLFPLFDCFLEALKEYKKVILEYPDKYKKNIIENKKIIKIIKT